MLCPSHPEPRPLPHFLPPNKKQTHEPSPTVVDITGRNVQFVLATMEAKQSFPNRDSQTSCRKPSPLAYLPLSGQAASTHRQTAAKARETEELFHSQDLSIV